MGSARDQLEESEQLTPLGSVALRAGEHRFELRYQGARWRPGSRGGAFPLGPLVLGRPATDARLLSVTPGAAASLCGHPFDWLEAVARG